MNQQYDEIIRNLMKEINTLKAEQKRFSAQRQLFTILNVNSPAQITANQNDYDPGDYDFLKVTSDAARNITGFSGGVNGRVLFLMNAGAQNIVLVHASGLSQVGNKIRCAGAVNHTMTVNATGTRTRVMLIYILDVSGEGFWNLMFESAP